MTPVFIEKGRGAEIQWTSYVFDKPGKYEQIFSLYRDSEKKKPIGRVWNNNFLEISDCNQYDKNQKKDKTYVVTVSKGKYSKVYLNADDSYIGKTVDFGIFIRDQYCTRPTKIISKKIEKKVAEFDISWNDDKWHAITMNIMDDAGKVLRYVSTRLLCCDEKDVRDSAKIDILDVNVQHIVKPGSTGDISVKIVNNGDSKRKFSVMPVIYAKDNEFNGIEVILDKKETDLQPGYESELKWKYLYDGSFEHYTVSFVVF